MRILAVPQLQEVAERIKALEAKDVTPRPTPSLTGDVWLGSILVIALALLLVFILVVTYLGA